MLLPPRVTMPRRSPSPSKARPSSASRGLQRGDQVLQVLGLARVGMVVGEVAVDLAEQLDHLAAEGAEDAGRRGAGDAVAGVDHDLHRAGQLDVRHDAVAVRRRAR